MNILVLNGSPRKNGNVAKALRAEVKLFCTDKIPENTVYWHDISDLNFDFCRGCMACRSKEKNGACILANDDAHKIAEETHNEIERSDENIKHCMVHVNPVDLKILEEQTKAYDKSHITE